jgi:hypothetical protein
MALPLPPFAYATESAAFERRWLEEIPRRLYELQIEVIPERNILKYQHGRGWTFNNTQGAEVPGEFKAHSNVFMVDADSRRNCEIEKLPGLADEMARNFAAAADRQMEAVIEETTEQTGNVVTWKPAAKNAPAVFLEMLRKVEFGVTPDGQPSLPSFYKFQPAFLAELQHEQATNPAFAAEVEKVKAQKIAEALAKEEQRKAKFQQTS